MPLACGLSVSNVWVLSGMQPLLRSGGGNGAPFWTVWSPAAHHRHRAGRPKPDSQLPHPGRSDELGPVAGSQNRTIVPSYTPNVVQRRLN